MGDKFMRGVMRGIRLDKKRFGGDVALFEVYLITPSVFVHSKHL